ncbi:MAG TPA: diacylglycerol kinase family protein, partial [Byssovorax sp.]
MRFDVVVNATAHLHRQRPGLAAHMRAVAAGRAEIHETADLGELDALAGRLAARGTDAVILSGGDGSFMAGATALARAFGDGALPRLGLLPGGTVATVARNWGMRGDPAELLARLLDAGDAAAHTERQTLRVMARGASGEAHMRVGFIFGTGLVASFFDVYYDGGARGYGASAKIVARIFVESFVGGPLAKKILTPLPCTIDVEGATLAPRAFSLVCASVIKDLGIGMKVTYRGGDDPERVHLVASSLPPNDLGPRVFRVLAGASIGGR